MKYIFATVFAFLVYLAGLLAILGEGVRYAFSFEWLSSKDSQ